MSLNPVGLLFESFDPRAQPGHTSNRKWYDAEGAEARRGLIHAHAYCNALNAYLSHTCSSVIHLRVRALEISGLPNPTVLLPRPIGRIHT